MLVVLLFGRFPLDSSLNLLKLSILQLQINLVVVFNYQSLTRFLSTTNLLGDLITNLLGDSLDPRCLLSHRWLGAAPVLLALDLARALALALLRVLALFAESSLDASETCWTRVRRQERNPSLYGLRVLRL